MPILCPRRRVVDSSHAVLNGLHGIEKLLDDTAGSRLHSQVKVEVTL
jgi:hypothetical protein